MCVEVAKIYSTLLFTFVMVYGYVKPNYAEDKICCV